LKPSLVNARAALLVLAALVAASASSARGADTHPSAAMMAPLKVLLAAANGNATADVKTICSDDAVIVDEVPPHRWNGASAAYDWLAALKSFFLLQGAGPQFRSGRRSQSPL